MKIEWREKKEVCVSLIVNEKVIGLIALWIFFIFFFVTRR